MLSGLRSTNCLKRATGHLSPPTENIRGWKSLFLLCSPPCLVFVGPSVNCTNSIPSSFLQSWKSSIFIAWCSWRPRRPKNCVKSHHIEEISASGVLEPNFSPSHSKTSKQKKNHTEKKKQENKNETKKPHTNTPKKNTYLDKRLFVGHVFFARFLAWTLELI